MSRPQDSEHILYGAAPAELPRAAEEILCVGQGPEIGAVWGCCALTFWHGHSARALAQSEHGGNFPPPGKGEPSTETSAKCQ